MKQLVCEMCGSTEFVKQDGVFACQGCGIKYSTEEAKRVMADGLDATGVAVTKKENPVVSNYLELSKSACDAANGESAFSYANKALEIEPQNHKAWIAKMFAMEYIGTLGNLQLTEVVEAGKKAITYAPEEHKAETEFTVYTYYLTRALSLLKLAMNKMQDTADIKRTYDTLCLVSFFTAARDTMNADNKIVNLYDNIADEAVALTGFVEDAVLAMHRELINLLRECAKQYQYETDALIARRNVYGAQLTSEAQSNRSRKKEGMLRRASDAERKLDAAEKIKQAEEKAAAEQRLKEYWELHAKEKLEIEERLERLKEQENTVRKLVEEKMSKLAVVQEEKKIQVPAEVEEETCRAKISELTTQKSRLGLFKRKEKQELAEEISKLYEKKTEISKVVEQQREERNAEISNKINAINEEMKPHQQKLKEIGDEVEMLKNELVKPR